MLVKTRPATIKAADPESGTFEAVVSVFGNVDSYGDVVMPGAFKATLDEWAASGDPIPVLYSHNSYDPDYNVGHVLEAKETDEGLWVKAQLDIESDTGKAKQVHRLLKGRRVKQFSFAYDVVDGGMVTRDEKTVYELRQMKLYEVGPCLIGANQETRLIGAKSQDDGAAPLAAQAAIALTAELKAGRVLSAANETRIRTAVDELSTVLDTLPDPKSTDSGKATADEPVADSVPDGAKSAPTRRATAADLSVLALDLEVSA